jgi:hypothetical protein
VKGGVASGGTLVVHASTGARAVAPDGGELSLANASGTAGSLFESVASNGGISWHVGEVIGNTTGQNLLFPKQLQHFGCMENHESKPGELGSWEAGFPFRKSRGNRACTARSGAPAED